MSVTIVGAERAAELLGVDVFDLGTALRNDAKSAFSSAAHARGGMDDERVAGLIERGQSLLAAAQACDEAWQRREEAVGSEPEETK